MKHFNINNLVLFFIAVGPLLDQVFHVSMFSRDPAPESTVLIMNIVFFLIYGACFLLFRSKKFWAKWISFSIYLLWFLISILIIAQVTLEARAIAEIIIRAGILAYLIMSADLITKYKKSLVE